MNEYTTIDFEMMISGEPDYISNKDNRNVSCLLSVDAILQIQINGA